MPTGSTRCSMEVAATGHSLTLGIRGMIGPSRRRQTVAMMATIKLPHLHRIYPVTLSNGPVARPHYGSGQRHPTEKALQSMVEIPL